MNLINISASSRLFIWDSLQGNIKEKFLFKLNVLLKKHSNASIEFICDYEPYVTEDNKILYLTTILDKIVARGNPTLTDINFENKVLDLKQLKKFKFTDLQKITNGRLVGKAIKSFPQGINYNHFLEEAESLFYLSYSKEQESYKTLSVLPPELNDLTSEEEDIFLEIVGERISKAVQCNMYRQVLISDLIGHDHSDVVNNRVDFSLLLKNTRVVIEIDEEDHLTDEAIKQHDEKRDEILKDSGWDVFRIKASDVRNKSQEWIDILNKKIKYDSDFIREINSKYLKNKLDVAPFLTILYPHIIHRTLRAIIQSLHFEQFPIKKEVKILVIEEDVPTVCEAIYQLYDLWYNLSVICNSIYKPPIINIHCIGEKPILPFENKNRIKVTNIKKPNEKYDLCISHSFTLFTGQIGFFENKYKNSFQAEHYFRIRTSPIYREYRKLIWSPPLKYELDDLEQALVKQEQDDLFKLSQSKIDSLNYFLNNIFRKHHFWDGQARVITRLLQCKPAIVLLPTGGGKSLTYQFAGLLTPGVTLIIDPLVSLMTDQVENLNLMGFDRAGFISSTLNPSQREIEIGKVADGQYYYVFVAPERLQIEDFRSQLKVLVAQYPISLAVIDEVHCVSEWGHDFRPSYLHLGKNIIKYCSTESGFKPTLVGLTGTASFAVLTDVQMELNIKEEDAIILPVSFDRRELIFHVEEVDVTEKESRLHIIKNRMAYDFKKNPQTFFQIRGEKTNSGIIFCPHVNGDLGVVSVATSQGHSNYYSGKKPRMPEFSYDEWREHKIRVQREFKYNKINEIVATKSFGMGIDKPNIRYTIHYVIPHSVEAFYQEAGRAGRDGIPKSAHCYVIYSDNNWDIANEIIRERNHKEAINRLDTINWNDRGDLLVQLWLLYNTYHDREDEKKFTFSMWYETFYPEVSKMPIDATNTISLPFDNDRTLKEKSIFRLVILGVVEEYSIHWRFQNFKVRVKNITPISIKENLKNYFLQYKFQEYAEDITSDIPVYDISETLYICLDRMIDFVYDEIVEKRKQALRTIAELCRNFESDKQFRENIIIYLQESEFSDELKQWINKPFSNIGLNRINDILENIGDLDQAKRLIGTSRRMLDEDPLNIALRYLSFCARVQSTTENDNSVQQEFLTLVNQINEQYNKLADFERKDILLGIINKVLIHRPWLHNEFLEKVLRFFGDIDFIKAYLVENNKLDDSYLLGMMITLITANALLKAKGIGFYQSLK